MKRKIVTLCIVALLIALAAAGTYSNSVYIQTTRNVITSGGVDIALLEHTADGTPYPKDPVVIMPGDVVSKRVSVENTGSSPAYLRVMLTPGVNDANLSAADCIQMDLDLTNWTYQDGYYYYNQILQPGQTTPALLTQVTFVGEKITNAYLGKMFSLDVEVQAVQSEHNGTDPLQALGWPET